MHLLRFVAVSSLVIGSAEAVAAQPCPEPGAHQFDFWIGNWNVNNRYFLDSGWRDVGSAEVHVFPVAGGCGVVELWDGMLGRTRIRGFSARTWNPSDSTWTLVLNWPQPNRATFSTLQGRFRYGRGDFYREIETDSGMVLTRYTFADIGPDRFRWNDGTSRDAGATWHTQWIMEYARRPSSARPVLNAALTSMADDPVCTGAAFDAAEPLLGRWETPDGTSLIVVRAIGGCAVLAFLDWQSARGPQSMFAILGYDYQATHWTAWVLSTLSRGFQELSGAAIADLSGGEGALAWSRRSDTELDFEWTPPSGHSTTFDLQRPGK